MTAKSVLMHPQGLHSGPLGHISLLPYPLLRHGTELAKSRTVELRYK